MKGLFIGLNTVDIQFYVHNFPGINQKVRAENYTLNCGGPATNAAVTFACLKGNPTLVTLCGKHKFTEFQYSELKLYKVKFIDLLPDQNLDPVFASVITSKENGDRSVVSFHNEKTDNNIYKTSGVHPDNFDIILTDTYYIGAAIEILNKKKRNIPVVLDGGSWKNDLETLLPYVNIAICSSDFMPSGCKSHQEVYRFLKSFGINKIAITRGINSVLVWENENNYELEIEKVNIVDTLGAGDVFHGAFCYFFSSTGDFNFALKKAALTATFSCQYFGSREWIKSIEKLKI